MPIYEYECQACGYQTELIQNIDEPAIKKCPKCKKAKFKKLISLSSFQLKGGGWYASENKKSKSKKTTEKE